MSAQPKPAGMESGLSDGTSAAMKLFAPAKINLHLRVGPIGGDGFHPVMTWMCTVSLFDILTFSAGRGGGLAGSGSHVAGGNTSQPATYNPQPVISLTCSDPNLPCDETNLVVRAGKLLAGEIARRRSRLAAREGGATHATGATTDAHGSAVGTALGESEETLAPVAVYLEKNTPSGAGLGGGSSDAATAMLGLNQLWRGDVDANDLASLSASLGSDVPFFFRGPSAICTGRGEIVNSIAPPSVAKWALLILPPISMPTPPVYRKFDELKLGRTEDLQQTPWPKWSTLSANELLPLLVNDLEAPAFALKPELAELRSEIAMRLGRPVRMSGSGSSLFTLFDSANDAQLAQLTVTRQLGVKAIAVELAPEKQ